MTDKPDVWAQHAEVSAAAFEQWLEELVSTHSDLHNTLDFEQFEQMMQQVGMDSTAEELRMCWGQCLKWGRVSGGDEKVTEDGVQLIARQPLSILWQGFQGELARPHL